MSKHTPWRAVARGADGYYHRVEDACGRLLAEFSGPDGREIAVLIAAAPELLAALEEQTRGLKWAGEHGYIETLDFEKYVRDSESIIARAQGEAK